MKRITKRGVTKALSVFLSLTMIFTQVLPAGYSITSFEEQEQTHPLTPVDEVTNPTPNQEIEEPTYYFMKENKALTKHSKFASREFLGKRVKAKMKNRKHRKMEKSKVTKLKSAKAKAPVKAVKRINPVEEYERGKKKRKRKSRYNHESYSFEDAIEQLVLDNAVALIVKKLTAENLEELTKLDIEVGIAVKRGVITLFTSGSKDEILVHARGAKFLKNASLVAHTHAKGFSVFPSAEDIEKANGIEYLVSDGIYAYNSKGLINETPFEYQYLIDEIEKVTVRGKSDIRVRRDLHHFIVSMDQLNVSKEDAIVFRAGDDHVTVSSTTQTQYIEYLERAHAEAEAFLSAAEILYGREIIQKNAVMTASELQTLIDLQTITGAEEQWLQFLFSYFSMAQEMAEAIIEENQFAINFLTAWFNSQQHRIAAEGFHAIPMLDVIQINPDELDSMRFEDLEALYLQIYGIMGEDPAIHFDQEEQELISEIADVAGDLDRINAELEELRAREQERLDHIAYLTQVHDEQLLFFGRAQTQYGLITGKHVAITTSELEANIISHSFSNQEADRLRKMHAYFDSAKALSQAVIDQDLNVIVLMQDWFAREEDLVLQDLIITEGYHAIPVVELIEIELNDLTFMPMSQLEILYQDIFNRVGSNIPAHFNQEESVLQSEIANVVDDLDRINAEFEAFASDPGTREHYLAYFARVDFESQNINDRAYELYYQITDMNIALTEDELEVKLSAEDVSSVVAQQMKELHTYFMRAQETAQAVLDGEWDLLDEPGFAVIPVMIMGIIPSIETIEQMTVPELANLFVAIHSQIGNDVEGHFQTLTQNMEATLNGVIDELHDINEQLLSLPSPGDTRAGYMAYFARVQSESDTINARALELYQDIADIQIAMTASELEERLSVAGLTTQEENRLRQLHTYFLAAQTTAQTILGGDWYPQGAVIPVMLMDVLPSIEELEEMEFLDLEHLYNQIHRMFGDDVEGHFDGLRNRLESDLGDVIDELNRINQELLALPSPEDQRAQYMAYFARVRTENDSTNARALNFYRDITEMQVALTVSEFEERLSVAGLTSQDEARLRSSYSFFMNAQLSAQIIVDGDWHPQGAVIPVMVMEVLPSVGDLQAMELVDLEQLYQQIHDRFGDDVEGHFSGLRDQVDSDLGEVIDELNRINAEILLLPTPEDKRAALMAYFHRVQAESDKVNTNAFSFYQAMVDMQVEITANELMEILNEGDFSVEEALRLSFMHNYFLNAQGTAQEILDGETAPESSGIPVMVIDVLPPVSELEAMRLADLESFHQQIHGMFGDDVEGHFSGLKDKTDRDLGNVIDELNRINAEFRTVRDFAKERRKYLSYLKQVKAEGIELEQHRNARLREMLGINVVINASDLEDVLQAAGITGSEADRYRTLHTYFENMRKLSKAHIDEDDDTIVEILNWLKQHEAFIQAEGLHGLPGVPVASVGASVDELERMPLNELKNLYEDTFSIVGADVPKYFRGNKAQVDQQFDDLKGDLNRINAQLQQLIDSSNERTQYLNYFKRVNAEVVKFNTHAFQMYEEIRTTRSEFNTSELEAALEAAGITGAEADRYLKLLKYFQRVRQLAEAIVDQDFRKIEEIEAWFVREQDFIRSEGLHGMPVTILEVAATDEELERMSLSELRDLYHEVHAEMGDDVEGYFRNIKAGFDRDIDNVRADLNRINAEFRALIDNGDERTKYLSYLKQVIAENIELDMHVKNRLAEIVGIHVLVSASELEEALNRAGITGADADRFRFLHTYFETMRKLAQAHIEEDIQTLIQIDAWLRQNAAMIEAEGLSGLPGVPVVSVGASVDELEGMSVAELKVLYDEVHAVVGRDVAQYFRGIKAQVDVQFEDLKGDFARINAELRELIENGDERTRYLNYFARVHAETLAFNGHAMGRYAEIVGMNVVMSASELENAMQAAGITGAEADRFRFLHTYFGKVKDLARAIIQDDPATIVQVENWLRQNLSRIQAEGFSGIPVTIFETVATQDELERMSLSELRALYHEVHAQMGDDVEGYFRNIKAGFDRDIDNVKADLNRINGELRELIENGDERTRYLNYFARVRAEATVFNQYAMGRYAEIVGMNVVISASELEDVMQAAGITGAEADRFRFLHTYFGKVKDLARAIIQDDPATIVQVENWLRQNLSRIQAEGFSGIPVTIIEMVATQDELERMSLSELRDLYHEVHAEMGDDVEGYFRNIKAGFDRDIDNVKADLNRINGELRELIENGDERTRYLNYFARVRAEATVFNQYAMGRYAEIVGMNVVISASELEDVMQAAGITGAEADRFRFLHTYFGMVKDLARAIIQDDPATIAQVEDWMRQNLSRIQAEGFSGIPVTIFEMVATQDELERMSLSELRALYHEVHAEMGDDVEGYFRNVKVLFDQDIDNVKADLNRINAEFRALIDNGDERTRYLNYFARVRAEATVFNQYAMGRYAEIVGMNVVISASELEDVMQAAGITGAEADRFRFLHTYFGMVKDLARAIIQDDPATIAQVEDWMRQNLSRIQAEGFSGIPVTIFEMVATQDELERMSLSELRALYHEVHAQMGDDVEGFFRNVKVLFDQDIDNVKADLNRINAELRELIDNGDERTRYLNYFARVRAEATVFNQYAMGRYAEIVGMNVVISASELEDVMQAAGITGTEADRFRFLHTYFGMVKDLARAIIQDDPATMVQVENWLRQNLSRIQAEGFSGIPVTIFEMVATQDELERMSLSELRALYHEVHAQMGDDVEGFFRNVKVLFDQDIDNVKADLNRINAELRELIDNGDERTRYLNYFARVHAETVAFNGHAMGRYAEIVGMNVVISASELEDVMQAAGITGTEADRYRFIHTYFGKVTDLARAIIQDDPATMVQVENWMRQNLSRIQAEGFSGIPVTIFEMVATQDELERMSLSELRALYHEVHAQMGDDVEGFFRNVKVLFDQDIDNVKADLNRINSELTGLIALGSNTQTLREDLEAKTEAKIKEVDAKVKDLKDQISAIKKSVEDWIKGHRENAETLKVELQDVANEVLAKRPSGLDDDLEKRINNFINRVTELLGNGSKSIDVLLEAYYASVREAATGALEEELAYYEGKQLELASYLQKVKTAKTKERLEELAKNFPEVKDPGIIIVHPIKSDPTPQLRDAIEEGREIIAILDKIKEDSDIEDLRQELLEKTQAVKEVVDEKVKDLRSQLDEVIKAFETWKRGHHDNAMRLKGQLQDVADEVLAKRPSGLDDDLEKRINNFINRVTELLGNGSKSIDVLLEAYYASVREAATGALEEELAYYEGKQLELASYLQKVKTAKTKERLEELAKNFPEVKDPGIIIVHPIKSDPTPQLRDAIEEGREIIAILDKIKEDSDIEDLRQELLEKTQAVKEVVDEKVKDLRSQLDEVIKAFETWKRGHHDNAMRLKGQLQDVADEVLAKRPSGLDDDLEKRINNFINRVTELLGQGPKSIDVLLEAYYASVREAATGALEEELAYYEGKQLELASYRHKVETATTKERLEELAKNFPEVKDPGIIVVVPVKSDPTGQLWDAIEEGREIIAILDKINEEREIEALRQDLLDKTDAKIKEVDGKVKDLKDQISAIKKSVEDWIKGHRENAETLKVELQDVANEVLAKRPSGLDDDLEKRINNFINRVTELLGNGPKSIDVLLEAYYASVREAATGALEEELAYYEGKQLELASYRHKVETATTKERLEELAKNFPEVKDPGIIVVVPVKSDPTGQLWDAIEEGREIIAILDKINEEREIEALRQDLLDKTDAKIKEVDGKVKDLKDQISAIKKSVEDWIKGHRENAETLKVELQDVANEVLAKRPSGLDDDLEKRINNFINRVTELLGNGPKSIDVLLEAYYASVREAATGALEEELAYYEGKQLELASYRHKVETATTKERLEELAKNFPEVKDPGIIVVVPVKSDPTGQLWDAIEEGREIIAILDKINEEREIEALRQDLLDKTDAKIKEVDGKVKDLKDQISAIKKSVEDWIKGHRENAETLKVELQDVANEVLAKRPSGLDDDLEKRINNFINRVTELLGNGPKSIDVLLEAYYASVREAATGALEEELAYYEGKQLELASYRHKVETATTKERLEELAKNFPEVKDPGIIVVVPVKSDPTGQLWDAIEEGKEIIAILDKIKEDFRKALLERVANEVLKTQAKIKEYNVTIEDLNKNFEAYVQEGMKDMLANVAYHKSVLAVAVDELKRFKFPPFEPWPKWEASRDALVKKVNAFVDGTGSHSLQGMIDVYEKMVRDNLNFTIQVLIAQRGSHEKYLSDLTTFKTKVINEETLEGLKELEKNFPVFIPAPDMGRPQYVAPDPNEVLKALIEEVQDMVALIKANLPTVIGTTTLSDGGTMTIYSDGTLDSTGDGDYRVQESEVTVIGGSSSECEGFIIQIGSHKFCSNMEQPGEGVILGHIETGSGSSRTLYTIYRPRTVDEVRDQVLQKWGAAFSRYSIFDNMLKQWTASEQAKVDAQVATHQEAIGNLAMTLQTKVNEVQDLANLGWVDSTAANQLTSDVFSFVIQQAPAKLTAYYEAMASSITNTESYYASIVNADRAKLDATIVAIRAATTVAELNNIGKEVDQIQFPTKIIPQPADALPANPVVEFQKWIQDADALIASAVEPGPTVTSTVLMETGQTLEYLSDGTARVDGVVYTNVKETGDCAADLNGYFECAEIAQNEITANPGTYVAIGIVVNGVFGNPDDKLYVIYGEQVAA